jgi:hypothetical protein
VQLRIGIAEAASPELVIDLPGTDTADAVTQRLTDAAATQSDLVWFVDRHGTRIGVPFHQINYIELSP